MKLFAWSVAVALTTCAWGTTASDVVQQALDRLYPDDGWTSRPVASDANVGLDAKIVTHPVSPTEPTAFVRMLPIPDRSRWLNVRVSSVRTGDRVHDWIFRARIDGAVIHEETIRSDEPHDIKLPLGAWAGKTVRLELESAAGGAEAWNFEYAVWHDIRVTEEFHPDWVKDLVIYEIATKSFNSPEAPEKGTFRSVQEKLPYLQSLGVNAIWLTGSDLADPHHFYNIWTQYASVRPDRIDPSLGTSADLKALTDAAHAHGIRVFLDVITHGVMNGSSLVKEHPDWFKGGSWGMTDYNWAARIPELDAWWVKTFTDYVLKDGVDGFRLDCGPQGRADLWREIKWNAWSAGREIAVLPEGQDPADGVSDACQSWRYLSHIRSCVVERIEPGNHVWNVGRYYGEDFASDWQAWNRKRPRGWTCDLMLPTIEVSCHDNGWSGFPSDGNPYVTEGSRMLMGYSALLAPAIPVLMMGEEFDAEYVPIPTLCGELFGKEAKTKGRWLYGSWIQWSQLEKPRHRDMLADTTRLLALRRRFAALLHARMRWTADEGICELATSVRPSQVPVPYLVYNRTRALLVAGNPTDSDVTLEVTLPLEKLGRPVTALKDVWSGSGLVLKPDAEGMVRLAIPKDRQPRGGLAVFEL